jgi:hypothetical protein
MITLQGGTKADALRWWIADGQRIKAAEYARDYIALPSKKAKIKRPLTRDDLQRTIDELREIVAALADGLVGIGDRYPGKQGAPPKDPSKMSDEQALRITRADMRRDIARRRCVRKANIKLAALLRMAKQAKHKDTSLRRRARIRAVLKRYGDVPIDRSIVTNARAAVVTRFRDSDVTAHFRISDRDLSIPAK